MYRKGVSALIRNRKKEFLLINLESFSQEFFAIPGGGVEEGESLEEAVYREVEEELNIAKKDLVFIGKSTTSLRFPFKTRVLEYKGTIYEGSERYFFGFDYMGNLSSIQAKEGEVRSYRWVKEDELQKYLLFENQCADTLEKIGEIFDNTVVSLAEDTEKYLEKKRKHFSSK